jgi:hypothetical protein
MDDSADHGRKTVFSVGGFVGESGDWFEFNRHWDRALKRVGVDHFRAYDCINLEGEFRRKLVDIHGLTTARVIADALMPELKQIIATSNIYAYSLAVLMEDYRKVLAEPDGAIVLNPDPFISSHYQFIGLVLADFVEAPRFEVCAFLYDETSKAKLMQSGWDGYKEANPNWARHAATLGPMDDKTNSSIQAADLLAYTTTKVYESVPISEARTRAQNLLKAWLPRQLIRVVYCDAGYLRSLVAANIERVRSYKAQHPGAIVL